MSHTHYLFTNTVCQYAVSCHVHTISLPTQCVNMPCHVTYTLSLYQHSASICRVMSRTHYLFTNTVRQYAVSYHIHTISLPTQCVNMPCHVTYTLSLYQHSASICRVMSRTHYLFTNTVRQYAVSCHVHTISLPTHSASICRVVSRTHYLFTNTVRQCVVSCHAHAISAPNTQCVNMPCCVMYTLPLHQHTVHQHAVSCHVHTISLPTHSASTCCVVSCTHYLFTNTQCVNMLFRVMYTLSLYQHTVRQRAVSCHVHTISDPTHKVMYT